MRPGVRPDLDLRGLLGELSATLAAAAASPAPPDQRVLLTATLDGVRYTLMHCRADLRPVDHAELSAREFEIARMIAHGYTNKAIAMVLDISTWTVDTYLRRIFTKLAVRTRSAMVTKLTQEGILDVRDAAPDWVQAWQQATNGHADSGPASADDQLTANGLPPTNGHVGTPATAPSRDAHTRGDSRQGPRRTVRAS